MTFDDGPGEVISATDKSFDALNKKVLKTLNPAPVIGELPDTYIKLPAGLLVDGEAVQDAEVRELTGEHEELLAKAKTANNAAKYMATLLQCGVVSIGDTPSTTAVLDSLIQGDLDMLMLGIRRATFGEQFEIFNVACPHCGELNDLKMNLKDIPVKELEDPAVREFEVKLRHGTTATVKFPTGSVQNEIFKNVLTVPEMNSLTLANCVLSFQYSDGKGHPCSGLADVKQLGIQDRNTLTEFIYTNQPGPRYDQVVAACSACEGEVPVPLNVGILFRDL